MPTRNGSSSSQSLRSEVIGSPAGAKSFDEAAKALGDKPTLAKVRKLVMSTLDDLTLSKSEAREKRLYAFKLDEWEERRDAAKEKNIEFTEPQPQPFKKVESAASKELSENLYNFVQAFQIYQGNDSVRDKNQLVDAFKELPKAIQDVLSIDSKTVKKLYRGDEAKTSGARSEVVASFATSPRNSGFWGSYLYKGTDVVSYEGGIDTTKVSNFLGIGMQDSRGRATDIAGKLQSKYGRYDFAVGDDEDERILYGIKWKDGVGNEKWMKDNDRDIKTLKQKKPDMFE
jgi:hypothetical protein